MSKIEVILNNSSPNYDIGEGGYGKVFVNSKFPNIVIKESKEKSSNYNFWKKEFEIQNEIGANWSKDFPKLNEFLEVVNVYELMFDENTQHSYILMDRICPLTDDNIEKLNGKTAHAFIGDCNLEVKNSGNRGILVGQTIVSKFVNLPITVNALAVFMSWLHYKMEYDGNDLEFILGKKCDSDKVKIFVLDFGMVEKINYKDLFAVENSLNSVPYFPLNYNCDKNSHDILKKSYENIIELFKNTYLSQSEIYGKLNIAKENYYNAK
jgi:hypothetical protein